MFFYGVLFLLLIALLIAVIPAWPYSRRWGLTPAAAALLVLLGFLVLTYIGYIGPWEQEGPPFDVEEGPDPDLAPGPEAAPGPGSPTEVAKELGPRVKPEGDKKEGRAEVTGAREETDAT